MANVRRLSDREIELLIEMWHNEPSLWNTVSSSYSDADQRLAALRRISQQLDGLDIGNNCAFLLCCRRTVVTGTSPFSHHSHPSRVGVRVRVRFG